MSKKSAIQIVGVMIAFTALIVALLAWLIPFTPIGHSPIVPVATSTSPIDAVISTTDCSPILLAEYFESAEAEQEYTRSGSYIQDERLHLTADEMETGVQTPSLGQYDAFTIEFYVYPIGEIYDGSVNILFEEHGNGGYELQLRLREHQFQLLRKTAQDNQIRLEGIGWTTNPAISLGNLTTKIRLDADPGTYTFWVNDQQVFTYKDSSPYLRGSVFLGIGAGKVSPISMELDNVIICGH